MESYKNRFVRLSMADTSFVYRGSCEFDIIRQPADSFIPWIDHVMLEGFRKVPCHWREGPGAVVVEEHIEGPGRIFWRFTPGPQGLLRFKLTVQNCTDSDWEGFGINIHTFPEPRLFRGEKTFVEVDGVIRELRELWPAGGNASQGVYPFKGVDLEKTYEGSNWTVVPCTVTAPFVYRTGGGNEPTIHARWCESKPLIAGVAAQKIDAVLSNYAWPCLDLYVFFDRIPSEGETTQEGLTGIMEGLPEDFVRYARGFIPVLHIQIF